MRISSLVRLLDPRVSSNMFIIVFAVLVGVGSGHSHGFASGIRGALVVFLAWAIGRELDPDRAIVACVAAVAAIPFAIFGDSDLLALTCVLLALRIAVRIAGKELTYLDCVGIVGLAALGGRNTTTLIGVGLLIAALLIDRMSAPRAGVRTLITAGLAGVAALTVAALHASWEPGTWHDLSAMRGFALALGYGLAAVVIAVPLRSPFRTRADATSEPLRPARLRLGRMLAAVAIMVAIAVRGGMAAGEYSALWAAMLAAAAATLWLRVRTSAREM